MIKSINKILAFFAFFISFIVYVSTMAPTASLWDCGEFIATSYKLGVPHQPGAPFYILLGNFISNIPIFENIGARVNLISPIASSFSVMFLYLIIINILEYFKGPSKNNIDIVTNNVSAFIGAMTFAFTDSHWFNAVESEIYALSTFFTAIVIWLILKWAHETNEDSWNSRYLLLIAYMIGLASGVHLLNLLAIPFITLIIFFKKFGNKKDKTVSNFFKSTLGLLPVLFITFIIFLIINKGIISGLPAIASRVHYFYFFIIFTLVLIIITIILYHIIQNKRTSILNFIPHGLTAVIFFIFVFLTYNAIFVKDTKTLIEDRNTSKINLDQELQQFDYAANLKKQVIQAFGSFSNAWNDPTNLQLSEIKKEIRTEQPEIYNKLNLDEKDFSLAIKNIEQNKSDIQNEIQYLTNNKIGIFSLLAWQSWIVNLGLLIIFIFFILLLIPAFIDWLFSISNIKRSNKLSYYNQIILSSLLLVIIGFSTYSTIFIRAQQDPNINMSSPDNFDRYVSYMNREQYGDINPFDKDKAMVGQLASNWKRWTNNKDKTPTISEKINFIWEYQVKEMYLRYFAWQFIGRLDKEEADYNIKKYDSFFDRSLNWIKGSLYQSWERDVVENGLIIKKIEPLDGIKWVRYIFPLAFIFGLIGIVYHFIKDWRRALAVLSLFLITGIVLSFYLNMHDPQPRERDYAFVGSFFAFSIWIGMGVSCLQRGIKRFIENTNVSLFISTGLALIIILLMPFNMYNTDYREHDRSQNFVAWDYAYNILNSCEPNAIIFTNGDNDTYPLWYLQEVEEIRTDVVVVNFSLLNTAWYIKQLIHKVPELEPIITRLNTIEGSLINNNGENFILPHWLKFSTNDLKKDGLKTITKEIKVFKNKKNIYEPEDYLIAKVNGLTCGLSLPKESAFEITGNSTIKNIQYKFYDFSENKIFYINESNDFDDLQDLPHLELSIKNDINIYDLEANVEYSTLASWELCDQNIKPSHYNLYQDYGIDTLIQTGIINSSDYIDCKLPIYLGNDDEVFSKLTNEITAVTLINNEVVSLPIGTSVDIQDVSGGFQLGFFNEKTQNYDVIFVPNSSLNNLDYSYFDFKLPRKHKFYILIQDYMVLEIINNLYHKRPIYFAATTPNLLGLNKYLQMEGMVYKLNYYSDKELLEKEKFQGTYQENEWKFINYDKMLKNLTGQLLNASPVIKDVQIYESQVDSSNRVYRFTNLNNPDIYYNHNIKRMMSNYRMAYLSLMQYELYQIQTKINNKYKNTTLKHSINQNTNFLDINEPMNDWKSGTIIAINNEHFQIKSQITPLRFKVLRGENFTLPDIHKKNSIISEVINFDQYYNDLDTNGNQLKEIIQTMNHNLPYELFPLNPWLSIQFLDKIYTKINSDDAIDIKAHIEKEIKNENDEMKNIINQTLVELEQNNNWNKISIAQKYKNYQYINKQIDSLDQYIDFTLLYRIYALSNEKQYNDGIIRSSEKLILYSDASYKNFINQYLGGSVSIEDLKNDIVVQLILSYQIKLKKLNRLNDKKSEIEEINNKISKLADQYPNIFNEAN